MKQATLIAFYGPKPARLAKVIADCQSIIAGDLGQAFEPFAIAQVHATLLGLERVPGTVKTNLNFVSYRNLRREMDVAGLADFLHSGGHFPLQVQIGGFHDRDYAFTSQGRRPYERSFWIAGDKAVLMGWPIRGHPMPLEEPSSLDLIHESRIYSDALDRIRQAAQSFNILHKYHRGPADVDNDLYLTLGRLEPSRSSEEMKRATANKVREFLSSSQPCLLEISAQDLHLVAYEDESLPPESTRAWPIREGAAELEAIWRS